MKQRNNQLSAKSKRLLLLSFLLALLPSAVSAQCPDNNHPHMIDLGLPSGTKWACCNVGAQKPEGYGGYYAWGETEEKDNYDWSTYIHCDGSSYTCHDIGYDIAGTQYDAATVNWGSHWMLPNLEQINELMSNCTSEWTTENGVNGRRFTGSNGVSIFLPAAGVKVENNLNLVGSYGAYSSSSFDKSKTNSVDGTGAYGFGFDNYGGGAGSGTARITGLSVRPVVAGSSTPSGIPIDETNFPDENFRNWVLAQNYGQDGVLTEQEINKVTEIDVDAKNISDLTGIEYFTSLTILSCEDNQLSSLDVSNNTSLTYLSCEDNKLSSLDVSKNSALTRLDCDGNQLIVLDVSNNTALERLDCSRNQIKDSAMDGLIAGLPRTGGKFYAIDQDGSNEQNVVTKEQVAMAKEKGWTTYYYSKEAHMWIEYEGSAPIEDMNPINEGQSIDIGNEIDEDTNLEGTVVDNVFVNISNGDGGFDPVEKCIIVNKPTDDSAIDGKDIFGDDFKAGYTGIVFKVAPGAGTVKVEAQTQGNMVLKVKIGNGQPVTMELEGKLKVSFPYNVSEETLVYIYGGTNAAGAKGMMKAAGADMLKIYGIEVTSEKDGIKAIDNGQRPIGNSPVYNLNGQRVEKPGKGIYIQNGRKVLVK